MPQGSTCWPYPHSTGPGPTRLGAGPHQAGRRRVIAGSTHVGHPSPRRDVRVRGARPLSASQAGFGLSTGGSPALQRQVGARADRCCAWSAAEGDSDGSHWDAAPSWRPTHVDPAVSVNLPAGQASGDPRGSRARLDPPRVRKVRPSGGPLPHACGPGWQERQVAQPVAIPGPRHTHCFTRMTGTGHMRPASRQSAAPHICCTSRGFLSLGATLFEDYFFSEAPHLLPSSRELHRRYEIGPPLHSSVSTQIFEMSSATLVYEWTL